MGPEFAYQVAIALITAGAIYGGIRQDLKGIHEEVRLASHSAARAHERLDIHIDRTGDK